MTQPQLATAAGIKQPSLSELETGETKEISGPTLIAISKAMRVRPEWLMTGDGQIEATPGADLNADELDLLELYRAASNKWKLAIKYMARMRADEKQETAVGYVLSLVSNTPVPDSKLGDKWTAPGKKRPK